MDIYNTIFFHLNDIDIVNFQSTCHKLNKIFYPLFYDEFIEMEYFNVVPNHILVSELNNKNLIKYSICIFDFTHNSFEINLLNNLKSAIISNTYDNLELYCAELISLIINENVENLKIHAPKLKELYIGYNNKIEYIDNKYIFELFCPNTITDNQKPVYYEIYSQLTDKDAKQYLIEMLTYGVI